ncbi:MAG: prenyltransferase [Syntrophomonadaceae bacterium]
MGTPQSYSEDLDRVLATRHANGSDFWATKDGRIGIEKPISTLTALLIMSDLKVPKDHEALQGAANLVLGSCQADGRVQIAPRGSIYPCHTAIAAAALCRNGYADKPQVQLMFKHLLVSRFEDGGWRCKKFLYGRGPETDHSNPGVTLFALDAFRCAGMHDEHPDLTRAVETLLAHWDTRLPIGPCHYGMGTLFMQVEYPFLRYNLFYYTYVLSFYAQARFDSRFRQAWQALQSKLDSQGRMIVERPNRKLADLSICSKGQPSAAATERYLEIVTNLAMN